jgi:hypothetical protein
MFEGSPIIRLVCAAALAGLLAAALALSAAAKPGHHHTHHGSSHEAGVPSGDPLLPPKGKVYTGASDTGQTNDYREFHGESGAHPAVMQSFESWGYVPKEALARWAETDTRGMLSLSTSPCWKCHEKISPEEIADGKGDSYLLALGAALSKRKKPTYIRLFPEMNGSWNKYSAFGTDGTLRDKKHTTKDFIAAWRRFVLIVRGGPKAAIDSELRKLHMPAIHGKARSSLPQPKVAIAWVPQSTGSPAVKGNAPQDYFPGWDYVDWVGADIYGKYPNFAGLDSIYRHFSKAPFLIGEWSPWDVDNPDFVKQLFGWIDHHKRARIAMYYQGFGEAEDNPFELGDYPKSQKQLKQLLNRSKYQPFAPENEGKGKGHKHGSKGGKKHGSKQ